MNAPADLVIGGRIQRWSMYGDDPGFPAMLNEGYVAGDPSAALRTILEAADDLTVVGQVHDGAEAAIRHDPDVILMDLHMPGVDGLTAIEAKLGHTNRTQAALLAQDADLTSGG